LTDGTGRKESAAPDGRESAAPDGLESAAPDRLESAAPDAESGAPHREGSTAPNGREAAPARSERSAAGRGATGALRELWSYRELFYFLAWRDVKVRYKQTLLGVLWALLQPFFTMIVFAFLFGRIANIPTDGIPGPVFYFSALLPWTYFSSTVTAGGLSLVSNANLLTEIYFPRVILPGAAALSGLVDFAVASLLLGGIMAYYRIELGWGVLLWPLLVVLLVLLALGVSAFLAAVNVRYRDVKYAIPFAIQLWLFVTPIIYPSSIIPQRYQWLLALNPLTGLIEAFRHALLPGRPIPWTGLAVSAALTLVLCAGGLAYFRRTERAFADII
jgi:lipopolysaccharide transport system permease protein